MSIFKEYKMGIIDEEEFKAAAAWEFRGENDCYYEPSTKRKSGTSTNDGNDE